MIAGLVLLVLLGVGLAVAYSRRPPAGADAPARTSQARRGNTGALLERAVAEGVVTREQADAVLALAPTPGAPAASARATAPGRVPPVVEILGYVGAVFALIGAAVLVSQAWDDLTTAGRLAIIGGAAVAMLVAGAFLDEDADPVLWRLRGFLWLLSSAAAVGVAALVAVDVLDWSGESVAITVGSAAAVYGMALWQLKDRPGEHLFTLAGLLVAVGGVMALLDGAGAVGLSVLAIGALWIALGGRDLVPPQPVAIVLGLLAVLVGPAITGASWEKAAPLIGLAVAATLFAIGTTRQVFVFTAAGAAGSLVYLPWALGQFFGDTIGVPVALLSAGLLLLVLMVMMLRHHHPDDGSGGFMPPHQPSATA